MTKQSAWMPLYIGDYLGDTQRLTTEQHGAYLLLLMDYWRNGPPPLDDAVLSQITRLPVAAWKKNKRAVLAFFAEADGLLRHGRVESEKARAAEHGERRSDKAKKAAKARWADAPSNAPSMPEALLVDCPPQSQCSDTIVSGAEAPIDVAKMIFDLGARLLTEAGTKPSHARSLLGKWRRDFGDSGVLIALTDCQAKSISNPVEWLPKRLAARPASFLDSYKARAA